MMYALWIGRIALATVFVVAATSKLRSRAAFHDFLESLPGFGVPAARSIGAALVLAELGAAGALVGWPRVGGSLAALLLTGFSAGIVRVLGRPEPVQCRCFGASRSIVGRSHLVRNLVLAALAVAVAVADRDAARASLELLAATAGGLGLGLLVTRWDDLVFIFSPPQRSSVR
ncbi:MAG: MauE/DoxX family redox-associated membrane protein [Kofleriaceae bacterium]